MRRLALLPTALLASLLVPLLSATPAYAADNVICVGSPAGPCDQTAPSISAAVTLAAGNSVPDTIFVGPSPTPYTDGPYDLDGSTHAVTLKGSGEGSTVLSLPPGGQQNYLALNGASVRDLTISLNTSSSDGDRGMVLYNGASAQSVTVAGTGTANTTGATMVDSTMSDVSIQLDPDADPGTRGIFSEGFNVVSDVTITAGEGYNMSQPGGTDTLRRLSIGAKWVGIVVDAGTVNVDNTLIQLTNSDGTGLAAANANPGEDDKTINADHVTVVGGGAGSTGALASAATPTARQLSAVNLTNSIVAGPQRSLVVEASNNGAQGGDSSAFINASYSNWDPDTAVETIGANGVGDVVSGVGNVDVPSGFVNQFAGNFRLQATSPLVDAGNPAAGGASLDLDGLSRVVDGNADGTARRDMGAYEYRVPAAPPPPADTTAPDTTFTKKPAKRVTTRKVKFRFTADETGVTFQCKRDDKAYKPCTSPFRWKVQVGKHVLRVRAVDAAGNVDPTPARYRFKRLPKPEPSGCTGEC